MPIFTDSKNFIHNEFAKVELGDQRLNKRLVSVAESLNDSPASSIPTMTNGEMAQLKGLYRFFQNDKVSEEKILQNHYANTVERMDAYNGKILLLNDSCFVTPRKGMVGLMSRGKGKENCVRVHYGLAASANGRHIFGVTTHTSGHLGHQLPPRSLRRAGSTPQSLGLASAQSDLNCE